MKLARVSNACAGCAAIWAALVLSPNANAQEDALVNAQAAALPFCIAPLPVDTRFTEITMVHLLGGLEALPVMDSSPMLPFKDSGAEAEYHRLINLANAEYLESIKFCNTLSVANRPACVKIASEKKATIVKQASRDRTRWDDALSEQSDQSSSLYFGVTKRKRQTPINM